MTTPTTRYEIASRQRFTDNGQIGVGLFLGSPILSGIGYAWLLNMLPDDPAFGPSLILFLSGMGFLIGCVMMLIGRQQSFDVRTIAVAQPVAAPASVVERLAKEADANAQSTGASTVWFDRLPEGR